MGRGRGRDRDRREERAVEPEEARRHGNDPDAVRIDDSGRYGGSGSEGVDTRYGQRSAHGSTGDYEDRFGERFDDRERGGAYGAGTSVRRASSGIRRHEEGEGEGDYVARRDSVRWGPIWAGLITALTTYLLLQLLAIGIGLQDIGPGANGAGGWLSGIIGIIAFFTGGSVAGMSSAVRGSGTGLLNGLLVWALGTVLILALSALGLGQVFGALGNVVGNLNVLQGGAINRAQNVNPSQVVSAVRTGAIGAFIGLLVAAIASALGGWLGGRTRDPIGRMARDDA